MSDVFQNHLEELSKAIADPAPFAKAFAAEKILSRGEEEDILDFTSNRTAQNRTDHMLITVSRRIHDLQRLKVVLRVLYRDVATKHIAVKMSEEGMVAEITHLKQPLEDAKEFTVPKDTQIHEEIKERDEHIFKLKQIIDAAKVKVSGHEAVVKEKNEMAMEIFHLKQQLVAKDTEVDKQIKERDQYIYELKQIVHDAEVKISGYEALIKVIDEMAVDPKQQLVAKDTEADEQRKERDQYISTLNRKILAIKEKVLEQEALIKEKNALLDSLSRAATRDACVQGSYLDYLSLTGESMLAAEVLAETIFEVTGDEHQSLSWPRHGFRLTVPAGAVPPGATISLAVKSILSGEFELPEKCELVSAIYWIKASQPFNKAVILHLHHCAMIESEAQCSHYKFVAGRCSQSSVPYILKIKEGGVFTPHTREASISVKQFSFFGIGRISPKEDSELLYTGQAFYRPEKGIYAWKFDFVIILDKPSLVEEVKEEYKRQNWKEHHDQVLSFKKCEDKSKMAINLCISSASCLGDRWELNPVNGLQIKKRVVDRMSEKSKPPYCRLAIKWRGEPREALPDVSRKVILEGSKPDVTLEESKPDAAYFRIELPEGGAPGDDDGEKDGRSSLGKHPNGATKEPSWSEVCRSKSFLDDEPSEEDLLLLVAMKVHDYFKLGIMLHLGMNKTEKIENEYRGKADLISMKILTIWKEEQTMTPITWHTLTQVLHQIGLNNVARNIIDELELRQKPSS